MKIMHDESADLYEQPLDPASVCPVVEEPPGVVTQPVVLPQALRQPIHPLHSGIVKHVSDVSNW